MESWKVVQLRQAKTYFIFHPEDVLKLCFKFTTSQPIYAYKRSAWKKRVYMTKKVVLKKIKLAIYLKSNLRQIISNERNWQSSLPNTVFMASQDFETQKFQKVYFLVL